MSSLADNKKGKVCLIKTDEQLSQEKLSLTNHVIQLVKSKYDITLPPNDIQACHRLPNKSVILRLWNRKEDSAWSKIVDGIKKGTNLEYNVYFNFHLTRRRSNLLYDLRQMKKNKEITKFYSDENGQLTVLVKSITDGGKKQKITYVSRDKGSLPYTLTKEELTAEVNKINAASPDESSS